MRHAIMVLGHGNGGILQKTIKHFDDKDIDSYIHWDKKTKFLPTFESKQSKIKIVERDRVFWGTDSQIRAELNLMKSVQNSDYKYDYIHLISSVDMPLMSKSYFKGYFKKDVYIGFLKNIDNSTKKRIRYYYPFRNLNIRKRTHFHLYITIFTILNKMLNINRLKKKENQIERGCNWFSMKASLIPEVVEFEDIDMFMHSYTADELFLQSILRRYKPTLNKYFLENDNAMALRYIDWERGKPYLFQNSDIAELRAIRNSNYAFARKISDVEIFDSVWE